MTVNEKKQYEELGFTLAQIQARLMLLFPVSITYEDWYFLHLVVDGDIDSLKKFISDMND